MKAAELLTIDVESELRRLADATLEGPWQVPTELVRRAVRAGARRVEVEIRADRVVVHDDAPPLPPERSHDLARLLDAALPPPERHQALLALEAEPELLSIAALRPSRVIATAGRPAGTVFTIDTTTRLDVAAARHWLRSCARFAPCRVVLDGAAVPSGFPSALAETALAPPLSGRLALTASATSHLWLLAHGIVGSHLTLPDAPPIEACLELGAQVRDVTPAALREAAEPHLGALVLQAVQLMLDVVVRVGVDDATVRALRPALLIAARGGWRQADVFRAPIVPVLANRRLSLLDLGRGRTLSCLAPSDDPAEYLVPSPPVVLLDEDERGPLAQLLSLRFRPLQKRRVPLTPGARLRGRIAALRDGLRNALTRLRHPGTGRVVPESAQSAEERAFVRALRVAAPDAWCALTDGAAPPHRVDGVLRLPRRHGDVAAAIRAVARQPAHVYLACLTLLDEAGAAPRATWREAREAGGGSVE